MAAAALAAMAFLAALLLAPGEARAADECGGTITSANLIRTCTAAHGGGTGAFATGIIYHGNGVNPGATGVADLRVPGVAGSTWTITSGDATGFPGSGIALDSRDGDIAGGGLALTVGGTGNVNIRQHSTRVNDGSNNNNGIVVNNQFTGASTTTVNVEAGVTIGQPAGTGAGRMKRNGIRVRVWLGSGAATITSAATIHSVFEGIDVTRGDSADTTAATTITNSGAISAGTRGIYLRYLAGDMTGGGGNTASTTTGNAKITNSGVITKHTGTGSQGAIELDYDRGHGDAEVDNRGAITATAAAAGYGIYLRYNNNAGTASGAATITNTAAVASKQHAIYLENAGGGASTITNSGALTAQNARNSGIYALHTGSAGAVTVTNSGAITSTATGIEVWSRNKNAASTNAGVSITHSDGAIAVSAGGGIKAALGDNDDTAANNAGNVVIKVTGGSVRSSGTILEGVNRQAGDVTIEVSEGVTLTSTGQHGVFADMPEGNVAGGVTITNAATITGPKTGIYVRRSATTTGAGAPISITNSGHIKKTGEANWNAIRVEDKNAGAVTVTNSGAIGEAGAMHQHGIWVEKQEGASGGVTVTSSGAVVTDGRGIYAVVNSGLAKLDVTGGSFDVDGTILEAKNLGSGDVDIDVAEGVTLTSSEQHGIFAELGADNAAGGVAIDNAGTITTPKTGIFVRRRAGDGAGAISVTNRGPIRKTGIENWMGIFVEEKGSGPVTVTNSGDIGAADARHDHGILVQLQHPNDVAAGDVEVTNSGDLMAALFGIWVPVKEADRQIAISQSGAIAARKGIYAQVGRDSMEGETRAAANQPLIDIQWTGGAFSHGTETAAADTAKLRAGSVAAALDTNLEFVAHETIVREEPAAVGIKAAVGIEAQVMGRSHVARVVAKGDDPGEIPDDEAEAADTLSDRHTNLLSADRADSRRAAILAQFRAVFEIEDLDTTSVAEAIDTDGDESLSDDEIVTYLSTDDDDTRALLRNVLAQSLSDEEKTVLRALVTGADKADLGPVLTAAGFTDDPADDADYWSNVMALLDNYNVGNIRVAMTGGSIVSRGDGIRAYYATAHDNNGAIEVTVGEGASVTGGEAGIWVANAGEGLRIEKRYAPTDVRTATGNADLGEDDLVTVPGYVKQVVRVDGTVTGGRDAAVHLSGGGALIVSETGKLLAGSSGRAVHVNDPGPAIIWIAGEVKGAAGPEDDPAPAAVHLTGGGSVTLGPRGSVDANGATNAIRGDGPRTEVVVQVAASGTTDTGRRYVTEDGTTLYQEGIQDVNNRVKGGVAGEGIRGSDGGGLNSLIVGLSDDQGQTGMATRVDLNPDGTADESGFDPAPDPQQPGPPPPPMMTMYCDMASDDRCRLYEALPSALLSMNGLPTHEERTSAVRDARGGWARAEAARGKWKADTSTQPNVAYDHRRYGVRAGMDFAVGETGLVGLSVHGLKGSAEMAAQAGEVDLSGSGLGVHGTAASAGGFYMDAQAAATWYDADLKSARGTLNNDVNGRGYALGVEVGKRMPAMGGGVTVTPRAGLLWSKVVLSDFRDARFATVSVKDAQSLKGRAGVGVEKVLDEDGMDGSRLFASLDVEQEFDEETEVMVSGTSLKASAKKTRVRAAVGAHVWGGGRYALQGSLGYTAGGGDNRELGAGLNFALRF